MANPYERMITDLIVEAEDGILDDKDESIISLFSDGQSENCCDDIDDDVEEIEDDNE